HRNAGAAQLRLASAADFLQHDMAGVAFQFGVGKGHPAQSKTIVVRYQLSAAPACGWRLARANLRTSPTPYCSTVGQSIAWGTARRIVPSAPTSAATSTFTT